MSIVVIGVNHRTGPLALLERVSIDAAALPKVIVGLTSRQNVSEAVVLSTCNRTEVYAVAERFHGAYADIRDFFCELGGLSPDELHPHLYSQHDEAAVTHLFEVAAGLDSAVLGESEILGQVRNAWEFAQSEGGARSTLNLLFRSAIETGKRARTETSIGRGTASVSHAAVEMATEHLGSLTGKRVLVVGAGEMGEGIALALSRAGVVDIRVTNRTEERALQLARRINGVVVPFGE
ncbi:MAG: glutamyl-tRNA reductase, partial [Ilumatobacteraceae bacterium]